MDQIQHRPQSDPVLYGGRIVPGNAQGQSLARVILDNRGVKGDRSKNKGSTSSRTRHGVGKFLDYYAQDVAGKKSRLFIPALACYREVEDMPKMWTKCGKSYDLCYRKDADESGSVENVIQMIRARKCIHSRRRRLHGQSSRKRCK